MDGETSTDTVRWNPAVAKQFKPPPDLKYAHGLIKQFLSMLGFFGFTPEDATATVDEWRTFKRGHTATVGKRMSITRQV